MKLSLTVRDQVCNANYKLAKAMVFTYPNAYEQMQIAVLATDSFFNAKKHQHNVFPVVLRTLGLDPMQTLNRANNPHTALDKAIVKWIAAIDKAIEAHDALNPEAEYDRPTDIPHLVK